MLLPVEERVAIGRLQLDHVRHQRLLSRALLRATLSAYAPLAPQDWRFEHGRYGRPTVRNSRVLWPLRFNLSHSDDIAVCAVAFDGDVGIDVETIIPAFPEDDCARRFAPDEQDRLLLDRRDRKASRFFDYWTLKEAYLKALGLGLNGGLDRIAFSFDDEAGLSVRFNRAEGIDVGSWSFRLLALGMARCAIVRRLPTTSGFGLRFFRAFSDGEEDSSNWPVIASAAAELKAD